MSVAKTLYMAGKKKPKSDRHTSVDVVRVPAPIAAALREIAAEEFTTFTAQVVAACRVYLNRRGRTVRGRSDAAKPRNS